MELFPSLYHEQPSTFNFAIREITTQIENPSSSVHPAAVPDRLLLKFVLRTHYKYTKISSNNTETTDREFDRFQERSFQFDMDVLKNCREAQEVISGMLGLFGVRIGDPLNENMARRIIRAGLEIGDKVSRPMLGLCVDMKRQRFGVRFEMTRNQRTALMRRMMMELDGMEAELIERLTRNDDPNMGMVPASESSISKALKRVRVGDDHPYGEESDGELTKRRRICVSENESCTICMEEFKGRSSSEEVVVVYMPCEHVFHDECIVTWLKQSHYCPVCRFQVSTTTESGSLDTKTL